MLPPAGRSSASRSNWQGPAQSGFWAAVSARLNAIAAYSVVKRASRPERRHHAAAFICSSMRSQRWQLLGFLERGPRSNPMGRLQGSGTLNLLCLTRTAPFSAPCAVVLSRHGPNQFLATNQTIPDRFRKSRTAPLPESHASARTLTPAQYVSPLLA